MSRWTICPPRTVKSLSRAREQKLRASKSLPPRITKATHIHEVVDHPLLTLLKKVNPVHNAFDPDTRAEQEVMPIT